MRSQKALLTQLKRAVYTQTVTPSELAYRLGYSSSNFVYKWFRDGEIPPQRLEQVETILQEKLNADKKSSKEVPIS